MSPRERSRRALKRSLRNCSDMAVSGNLRPDAVEVARIDDAMRRLSPIEREVLLAVRLEDCGYTEIANRLGLSAAEVEQLFARALSELMRNLDQPSRHWRRRWLS